MSHFAGVLSLHAHKRTDPALKDALLAAFNALGGTISSFTDDRLILVHADYIHGREPGWIGLDHHAGALALAGDLVLVSGRQGRRAELESKGQAIREGRWRDALQDCAGTFALCCYHQEPQRLVLATDSLGARPLYWFADDAVLVFSTCFRILARLPGRRFDVDWQAVAEQAAFCYPLGTRTLLQGISVLRDGEALVAGNDHRLPSTGSGEKVASARARWAIERYHEWEKTPLEQLQSGSLTAQLYDIFLRVVADRCPTEGPAYTTLTGGLDSRTVTGALLDLGRPLKALNCSRPGWQDYELAHAFAARAGVPVTTVDWTPDVLGSTAGETTSRLLHHVFRHFDVPEAFSGDGGGETVGFLMMAPKVMTLLTENRIEEAIYSYATGYRRSRWVLHQELDGHLAAAPERGMTAEFDAMADTPPQKRMQLFLLRNDLRRHLHDFFDVNEKAGSEVLLPFYDKRFLESVIRIAPPLDPFLGHRLYHEWIRHYRAPVAEVPWQVYPSHASCPLPPPAGVLSQWEAMRMVVARRLPKWRKEAMVRALRSEAPPRTLSRARLLFIATASILGYPTSSNHFREYLWMSDVCRMARGASS